MTEKKKADKPEKLDTSGAWDLLNKLIASGTGDEKIARAENWLDEQQKLADRKEEYTEPTAENLLLAMRTHDVTLGAGSMPRWPEGTVEKAERILAGVDPVATPFGRPRGQPGDRAYRARESIRPEGATGPPVDPRVQHMQAQDQDELKPKTAEEMQAEQLAAQKEQHEKDLAEKKQQLQEQAPAEEKAKEAAEAAEADKGSTQGEAEQEHEGKKKGRGGKGWFDK